MAARSLALNASISGAWRKYNVSLQRAPVATKAITCMAAYAIGDLTAQARSSKATRLDRRITSIDFLRTARAAVYGLLWCGPACHSFYARLDRVFARQAQSAVATIAGKVAADQLLFVPVCTAVFIAWSNLASGTTANTGTDLKEKLPPSVQAAWALWVPAMTINMALVPAPMRILFINAMSIVWTNILSSMAADDTANVPATMPADVDLLADAANVQRDGDPASLPALVRSSLRRVSSSAVSNRVVATERTPRRLTDTSIAELDVEPIESYDPFASMRSVFNVVGSLQRGLEDEDSAIEDLDLFYNSGTTELVVC